MPGSHYKPLWLRILAIVAAMTVMAGGAINYTKAGQVLQVQMGYFNNMFPDQQASLAESDADFVKRWWQTFKATGALEDAPRAGRPRKIPDAMAIEAAQIISRGYTVETTVRQQRVVEHKYFSTVAEAVEHNDTLRGMLNQLHATPEQLLAAMHRAAPELVHRRVSFRHQLSVAEKAKRVTVSRDLLARYTADHTLLQRMVFIDETTIQTHGLKRDHIEVWVNNSDPSFHDFHGVPGKAWDPVKVHVIAAVSSHSAYEDHGGLVYMDFTTGTTDINRRHNKRLDGGSRRGDYKYTVSVLPPVNVCDTTVTGGLGQVGVTCKKGLGVWQALAIVSYPLASIAGAEHNTHKTLGSSQGSGHNCRGVQISLMHPHNSSPIADGTHCLLKVCS